MIRFLSPGFAWALAAPAAILVLYLLRRRFLPRQVPSVFLWQRSRRDEYANRPFQRLVKSLLLAVQMLAALVLALALMRPAIPGGTAGQTVLIFDVSGSMQAKTGDRSRIDLAKEEALALVRTLPAEEKITVLTAGEETGRLALSADREEAEKAIGSVTCGREGADIGRALSLADAVAREADTGTTAVVFSDTFRREDAGARNGAYTLLIINCGTGGGNRAVCSLEAENGQAYARVANFGETCSVSVICEADGVLCDAGELEIPAGETAGIRFSVPGDAQRVRVSLRGQDALEADNTAETAVRHATQRSAAVLSDSVFLESALRVRPDLTVLRTAAEALSSTEADLYILGTSPMIITRSLPEEGYDPEALSFGEVSWQAEETAAADSPAAEILQGPLTEGLTLKNVSFRSFRPLSGGRAAVTLDGEPVVVRTDDAVVLGFDLHNTNLPLKYDYPVLIQNILEYLLPEETGTEADGVPPMPVSESDVRRTAPSDRAAEQETRREQGRELTDILLGAFLALLLAELVLSRAGTRGRKTGRKGAR